MGTTAGISISEIAGQGEFAGTATTTGDSVATLEVCPADNIVWTCRRTTLAIHVLAAAQPQVTGTSAPAIAIVGLSSLLIGGLMARPARRRAG